MSQQQELELPFPELTADQPPIPARMLNEFVYCPRLAYLEWVQGEWADSADTVDGRRQHRRVDVPAGHLPSLSGKSLDKTQSTDEPASEADEPETIHARSITLSSNRLGLIAKLDLVEGEGTVVRPVDYKRGRRPHVARGAYEPELVQLCAQAMLLEEHGFEVPEGYIYFVAGRERVRVLFDDELRSATRQALHGLRGLAMGGQIPAPLVDSPKCPRCSLVGICLPDETRFLQGNEAPPRPIAVASVEALPLYVQSYNAKLAKHGDTITVTRDDVTLASVRINEVSQVVLFGNVYVTAPTLAELMQRDIPVSWHSYGGWFFGHTAGNGHKNVELRTAQYRISFEPARCLRIARALVAAKIVNQRVMLRRNWKAAEPDLDGLRELKRLVAACRRAENLEQLLGIEGQASAVYFARFRQVLKLDSDPKLTAFDFKKRNRRPPSDPVNAMLSLAYSLLARTVTTVLTAVGFDAFRGFYHQPRYGRPALALDLMEPFRPLLADSVVVNAINNGEIRPSDFVSAGDAVNLDSEGRKRFIAGFERRLSQTITHPLFGYTITYRQLLEVEARLLGRHLLGELPDYAGFTTR